MTAGRFVVLDGIDGTGKTTHVARLADWLRDQGRAVTTCRDPGGTRVGDQLRKLVLHAEAPLAPACEALLFMASRAQLVHDVIRPALQRGDVVISDRFVLANLVYQGDGAGLNLDELRPAATLSTQGVEPDLTVVLDVPRDVAQQRRKLHADKLENRGAEHDNRVRQAFLREAARHPRTCRVIDATGTLDDVQRAIREAVLSVL